MSTLVTGAAGFIGFHVARALLERGDRVVGIDNLNDYYDVRLKEARLDELAEFAGFTFVKLDIADRDGISAVLRAHRDLSGIIHLAAQAGVRYSLENPYAYIDANVMGTIVMLEAARRLDRLDAFTYASSSSVYGANKKQPFSVDDPVEQPVSLYAATKRSCELIARSYSHLYRLPATGLRFFTAYGPWGRPDMAAWLFTKAILAGEPIKVFNEGHMARDFTYIDDIVAGTIAAHDRAPAAGAVGDEVPHRIYNLGNHRPERLLDFIAILERALGRTAIKELLPLQPGDVPESFADIETARRDLGFEPKISIEEGIGRFVQWYKRYHRIN
ncbi:MAG TPA: SDR family NAD(P)-dependent oxidoreductase [Stellaceae bacterium]|jgi:UDP-glucuronate 4-epimerase|nr:SDR family NAD(P)-dependent oxidoreductase [Stellaceae bacterium]